MYWNRDVRYRAGGFWRCAVKKRAAMRDLYDRDPVKRITKILRSDARRRERLLERAHKRMEALRGSL